MRSGWGIRTVWFCFVARVWFYAAVLPVWEGYDEWSHFAVIRLVARGQALPPRDSPLPRDVGASLDLVPVPWAWRMAGAPRMTHDEFWQLPRDPRDRREIAFRVLPRDWQWKDSEGSYRAHEAYQPPLYYWTMAPLMVLLGGAGIARQLLYVRWFGAILSSFAIPLTFLTAREVLGDRRIALGCAAIVAVMPGFALVAGHAGNDSLAVALFSLLIWCGARIAGGNRSLRDQLVLGAALGLGLLTKAYFLTAIPAVAALAIWKLRWRAAVPLALALLIGGWWYARAYVETGTLTGLTDFMMARDAHAGAISRALALPWAKAVDSILFSHLYAGGWSFLQVRSWMYHVFYLLALAGLLGLVRARRTPAMLWLAGVYACFWAGELYHVWILWVSRGVATSMGYYLYAVVAAEITLCTAGWIRLVRERWSAWAPAAGAALFAALDLYAMHAVAIPYYTGLIRHKPNGALESLHGSALHGIALSEILHRIAAFKAPTLSAPIVFLLWIGYLAGTALLLWVPARQALRK